MPTTDEIVAAAEKVGSLLAEHDAVKSLNAASKAFRDDVSSQRAILDFNRLLQTLAQKEASGQPIEVSDKQQLRELQDAVIMNPQLQRLQMAQMDYVDLQRKIDDAVKSKAGVDDALAPPASAGGGAMGGAPSPGPLSMG